MKLQKVILGPDWIDLSYGEPVVVTQALHRTLNRVGDPMKMPKFSDLFSWTYQPAAGKPDLVKILEKKYDAKVVVTNGAKQALGGALYSLMCTGHTNIWYDKPFYPANVQLTKAAGLVVAEKHEAQSFLITSPNNPDGANMSNVDIMQYRHLGPTIHDAAYYTPIYLPQDQIPIPQGHIQVFSMSKMYGLSGLRIGYAVCHDEKYYKHITEYVETQTAGVSAASQDIARNIEAIFQAHPEWYEEFTSNARKMIQDARAELSKLDPEVLIVEESGCNSMFAWAKIGPKLNNKAAKVHILPGDIFGKPGYVRMNIAHPVEIVSEAVSRLNRFKDEAD